MTRNELKAKEIFQENSSNLLIRIQQIIASNSNPIQASMKINQELVKESIFIHNQHLQDKLHSYATNASIDPLQVSLTATKSHSERINANSFGPYIPKCYFSHNCFRVLWLLDEPYIQSTWHTKKDRGGHIQNSYYNSWSKILNENHYISKKIIPVVRNILNTLIHTQYLKKDILDNQGAMVHLCCLEINHFPGIGVYTTKENDTYINRWGAINRDLISTLINFYNPNLILGSSKNLGIASNLEDFEIFNWLRPENNNLSNYPTSKDIILASRKAVANKRKFIGGSKDKIEDLTATAIYDSQGTIWIGWKHPSNRENLWDNKNLIDWICDLNISWPKEVLGITINNNGMMPPNIHLST